MANRDQKLLNKREVLLELLRTHALVSVHVDTRVLGTVAPAKLLGQPQVAFQLGNNLAVPIQDLTFHVNGWSATLSFNRVPFNCFFPWKAVFFMVADSGYGATWPSDTPAEVLAKVGAAPKEAPPTPVAAKRALPPGWKIIEGGGSLAKARAEAKAAVPLKSDKAPQPKPKRGYRKPGPFLPPSA